MVFEESEWGMGSDGCYSMLPIYEGKDLFLRRNIMSRFEKFQNIQVLNANGEPLNEQLYINDCIINFENGFISNLDYDDEDEYNYPAINCIDGHIEYWENGKLNNKNDSAVLSTDYIESWENGNFIRRIKIDNKKIDNEKEYNEFLFKKAKKAESYFSKYLNKKGIPFIHLDQTEGDLFSYTFEDKSIKRPDYLIFLEKKPLFIDVKAKSWYSIDNEDFEKLNALKNEYFINVIFAITDINKTEYNNFRFLLLDDLNKYIKIKYNNKKEYYLYSKSLLNVEITTKNIDEEKLKEIYNNEKPNDKYKFSENQDEKRRFLENKSNVDKICFSDILKSYFKENDFKIRETQNVPVTQIS